MAPVITLLIVVTLSILVTRVASVALSHTGLSMESARFQARSAFTGVGFTTSESEKVVNHPVRRRIALLLMLLGNAGIISAVSSLILTAIELEDTGSMAIKVVVLVTGLVCLWGVASSRWVDHYLSRLISWALKRYSRLEVRDYANLLRLKGEYRVNELQVREEDWLTGKTLQQLELDMEGLLILGIERAGGNFVGAPKGSTRLHPGDTVIIYGRASILDKLDERRKGTSGDREHDAAVAEQEEVSECEQREDDEACSGKEQEGGAG
jgi:hypothetical protein